jgi:acyl-coenzyme A thioesterase PaaI-like protein
MTRLSALLEEAVLTHVGAERAVALVSLSVEYAKPPASGAAVATTVTIDRATKSLVFARAEARGPGGALAASASAVLRAIAA